MATGLTRSIQRLSRHSAVRFAVVGGLSFVVDAGSLFLLHGVAKLWLPAATTLAYAVAFVVNFGLNRQWAFAAVGAVGRQLYRYLVLVGANLVLTVAGVQGLTSLGLPYLGSKLVTSAIVAVINYFAFRRWVFAGPTGIAGAQPATVAAADAVSTASTVAAAERDRAPA